MYESFIAPHITKTLVCCYGKIQLLISQPNKSGFTGVDQGDQLPQTQTADNRASRRAQVKKHYYSGVTVHSILLQSFNVYKTTTIG